MARFFKPEKNKKVEQKHQLITIKRLDHHGDGVGFLDKKPVFVPGTLPGEQALVQLTEQKRQYARGQLIKLDSHATQRVEPGCPVYQQCGGCSLQHLSDEGQVAHKQQTLNELMQKFAGEDATLSAPITGMPWHYRRRARISLQVDKKGALTMGFRARQRSTIINVSHCPVLSEPLNTLLARLRPCLDGLRGRRILGHLDLIEADNTAVVSLRTTKMLHNDDRQALYLWAETQGCTFYLHQGDTAPERLIGAAPDYQVSGYRLAFEPNDFIQVNPIVNQDMVSQALDWLALEKEDRVLDLFCGLGNFSVPAAKQVRHVVGVEGVQAMVNQAADNAQLNDCDNIHFYQSDLNSDALEGEWTHLNFTKILLDPARAGAAGVIDFVAQSNASHIVYVSCNPATLARDARVLLDNGYALVKLGMLDMFPQTGHMESMALFKPVTNKRA